MTLTPGQKINAHSWGMASPGWWAGACRVQLGRLEATLTATAEGRVTANHLLLDGFNFAVALWQVLWLTRAFERHTGGDPDVVAARDRFLESAGDVKDLRDALMYLDDKVIQANTSGMGRPAEVDLKFERIMDGDLELRIGGNVVRAWAGTRAAEELAEALRPVTWEQGESAGAPAGPWPGSEGDYLPRAFF